MSAQPLSRRTDRSRRKEPQPERGILVDYSRTVRVDLPYEQAVERTRAALSDQGFGVLTEIDVRATLKNKLDVEMEDYVILGACNPQLAHRALDVDRTIGLLLPCNVVVRRDGAGSIVEALDPQIMVSVPEIEELSPIAEEAGQRIQAALERVAAR
jgi:uncharacterized protein (DUF302 family)